MNSRAILTKIKPQRPAVKTDKIPLKAHNENQSEKLLND